MKKYLLMIFMVLLCVFIVAGCSIEPSEPSSGDANFDNNPEIKNKIDDDSEEDVGGSIPMPPALPEE